MKLILLLGRILYALIFLLSGFNHFMKPTIAYADLQGVPVAIILVPVSGLIAVVGAMCILLGYKAKFGAWLLALFLIPVTIMMHHFWDVSDPNMAQMQMAMFLKNLSMLGGALLIAYFGAGPMSLDEKIEARRSMPAGKK